MKARFKEDFKDADKVVLLTLFAFFIVVAFITSWHNGYFTLGIVGGGIVFGICLAAYKTMPGEPMTRVIMALGLVAMMAITVQQANGLGEGHFLFFLNFTILIRYRDIVPLASLIVMTVLHHITLTYCQSVGVDLFGTPLTVFTWGEETGWGIIAPLMYHVLFAVIGAIIATYYILDGNVRFFEASQVIGVIQDAATGDLSKRIESKQESELTHTVNGFFEELNNTLSTTARTAHSLHGQAEDTTKLADKSAQEVQQQREELTKISSAVNEMNSATRDIASNAEQTSSALNSAVTISADGKSMAVKFEATIKQLSERVNSATNVLTKLEEGSQQINTIVSTIKGISEQTNLLALNAAIEAARAGEQGRGFAVVADEVRVLSQRTHDSTEEISSMIGTLQDASNSAVETMRGCHELTAASVEEASAASRSFSEIAESINTISSMATQIATAAEEQSVVTEEINRNASNITITTEQFYEDANASLAQASSLNAMSNELNQQISRFKLA
jgi:methyl-accepting chemotaxis protein